MSGANPPDPTAQPPRPAAGAKAGAPSGPLEDTGFLAGRMGLVGIVVLEVFFVLLGGLTAYALWLVWPLRNGEAVQVWGWTVPISSNPDARHILIAGLSGVLGAFIASATSFATYLGNRTLIRSWAGWYVLRPVIGMAIGLLFYFLLRAGLVTTSNSGADAINEFGVAAIAGLAGMFSKQATDKLREVFDQFFHSSGDQERKDKPKTG